MNCKICNSSVKEIFSARVLDKYEVKYYQCQHCGFAFTENPYWLDEAYNSALNIEDTGEMRRNIQFRNRLSNIIFFLFDKKANFIDWGGGYGTFTRLMRDAGFNYFWSDKYAINLHAKGFEYDGQKSIECLSCFEVFEHLLNPYEEIEKMLDVSKNIFFSTQFISEPAPNTNWWYYAFQHGQHIAFFTRRSLEIIATKYDLNFYTNGSNLHLLSKKKFPKFVFPLLVKLSKYGLFNVVKLFLDSKTDSDSEYLSRIPRENHSVE